MAFPGFRRGFLAGQTDEQAVRTRNGHASGDDGVGGGVGHRDDVRTEDGRLVGAYVASEAAMSVAQCAKGSRSRDDTWAMLDRWLQQEVRRFDAADDEISAALTEDLCQTWKQFLDAEWADGLVRFLKGQAVTPSGDGLYMPEQLADAFGAAVYMTVAHAHGETGEHEVLLLAVIDAEHIVTQVLGRDISHEFRDWAVPRVRSVIEGLLQDAMREVSTQWARQVAGHEDM